MASSNEQQPFRPDPRDEKAHRLMDAVGRRARELRLTGLITVELYFSDGGLTKAIMAHHSEKML